MSQGSRTAASWIWVGVIFVVGSGLGFAGRQGWVDVRLLPAATGVIDPARADQDQEIAAAPSSEPAGETTPPTAPRQTASAVAVPQFDEAIFQQQSEPQMTAPPEGLLQPYRRGRSSDHREAAPLQTPSEETATGRDLSTHNERSAPVRVDPAIQTAAYTTPAADSPGRVLDPSADNALTPAFEEQVAEYDRKVERGEILAAHRLLSQLYWKERTRRAELMERLDRTASMIFFQPQPHFLEPYVIQPGDRLEKISQTYKVPWEYLAKLNRTSPQRIQAGKRLKVVRGPFAAVVELTDFTLTLHLQGYYVRRLPVGIGRDGSSPVGRFAVLNKVVNPQYTDPDGNVILGDDPANPLGERWIDLGNSYGIHGTIEPDSIGKASSRGCIRLGEVDIVTVYDFLTIGSDVVIRR